MTTYYKTTPDSTKTAPKSTLRGVISRASQHLLPSSLRSCSLSSRLPNSDDLAMGKAILTAHISVLEDQIRLQGLNLNQSTATVNESAPPIKPTLTQWTNLTLDDLTRYKSVLETLSTGFDTFIALSKEITDRFQTTQSEITKGRESLTQARIALTESKRAYKRHYSTKPTKVRGARDDDVSTAIDRIEKLTKGMADQEERDNAAIGKILGKIVDSYGEVATLGFECRLKSPSFETLEDFAARSEEEKDKELSSRHGVRPAR